MNARDSMYGGIANSCWTDEDYSDPGSLPSTVSVGDTVTYIDKDNVQNQFVVRHIEFTEFDKDLNFSYGGKRYSAKRGETNSTIIAIDHTEPSMAKPRMNAPGKYRCCQCVNSVLRPYSQRSDRNRP
jgi:hypothetical protein